MHITSTHADFVVIGGGFAGLATAYYLSQSAANVLLLERHSQLAPHASSRNAAIFRQLCSDASVFELAVESASLLRAESLVGEGKPITPRGNYLAADDESLLKRYQKATSDKLESHLLDYQEVVRRTPFLRQASFSKALYVPTDGEVDLKALQDFYAKPLIECAATRLNCELLDSQWNPSGWSLKTTQGDISAKIVVNAAGAWACEVARRLGGQSLSLKPYKRHLYQLEGGVMNSQNVPFFWHEDRHYYFRAWQGGVLASLCEELAGLPGDEQVVEAQRQEFVARMALECPKFAKAQLKNWWACQRTFAVDRYPVLGWDAQQSALYWVAALGGQGVSLSAAVGHRAATDLLAGRAKRLPTAFSPNR